MCWGGLNFTSRRWYSSCVKLSHDGERGWCAQEKVQACVQLFARVTDPHNLDDMTDVLEPKQQAEVAAILGPLSRCKPRDVMQCSRR